MEENTVVKRLGQAPEYFYEPSFCNQALQAVGHDIVPPQTLSALSQTPVVYERPREGYLDYAVGRRIRALRKRMFMQQVELARMAGMTPKQLCDYELGKRRISVSNANRIAHLLGVTTDDLLDDGADGRRGVTVD